ncbi:hypothetical protein H0W80_04050 [Candidatus Saccharibacteria bacterium]|nr:hypothetical protein [Candidatus Saccharibacteria bacterium]
MTEQLPFVETEKPQVLYHASPNQDIEVFQPKREGFRDPDEGLVVFATPDKAYATMFLVKCNDSWVVKGRFSEAGVNGPWHIIISDKERFEQADKGGSIYEFDPSGFKFEPDKNMGSTEWTSKESVGPNRKVDYPSALQAMIKAGIQVYFVDQQIFDQIRSSGDDGYEIIKSLQYITEQ